jgi:hypothetical protein
MVPASSPIGKEVVTQLRARITYLTEIHSISGKHQNLKSQRNGCHLSETKGRGHCDFGVSFMRLLGYLWGRRPIAPSLRKRASVDGGTSS